MTTNTGDQIVEEYLARFERASRVLPAQQRGRLREQIRSHLEDELADSPTTEAALAAIGRLGSPEHVVADAEVEPGDLSPAPSSGRVLLWVLVVIAAVWVLIGLAGLLAPVFSGPAWPVVPGVLLLAAGVIVILVSVRRLRRGR
jgi:hypothetical protein